MGKREIIKDTPSSSSEAAVPPTPVSEPDATVTPKMALAGVDPGKVEMPKAANISAPRIEIAETNTETIAAGKNELANNEAPHPAPQNDEIAPSSGGDAAATDHAAPGAAEERASPYVSRFSVVAASLPLGAGAGGAAGGGVGLCRAGRHPRRRGGASGARGNPGAQGKRGAGAG